MIYLKLFWSFFQIGLFSFGGGYAALPLIQNQMVELHHWLSLTEFTDLITISQMMPGSIAVNSATFVGIRIAGFLGAIVATLGCILPSCIIVSIVAYFYFKYKNVTIMQGILDGLRPTVIALIACAGLTILLLVFFGTGGISIHTIDWIAVLLFTAGIFFMRKFKINPMYIMLAAGVIGGIIYPFI